MAIKFGEIEVTQILVNEFNIRMLQETLLWIYANNEDLVRPDEEVVDQMKSRVIKELKGKYPKMLEGFEES